MKSTRAPSLPYTLRMEKNKTIWIIDDDPIQIFIAKRQLKNLGFSQDILTMANAKNALEEIQNLNADKDRELPDLILVDLNMPQMDGWEFLEEYDKITVKKKVDIYLVTSSIDPVDMRRAEAWDSVKGYLAKPLKTEELVKILNKYEKQ